MLKSNGLHRPKIRLKKFSFSLKIVPAYISKKLPSQCWPKPLFIAFFNFSHKWPTFAFTSESGYTLGFRRKIAHKGTHGETRGIPSLDHNTVLSCQRNFLFRHAFIYIHFPVHREPPLYQQGEKIRQSCRHSSISDHLSSCFSTSPTNGPRLLSQPKTGTHSAL